MRRPGSKRADLWGSSMPRSRDTLTGKTWPPRPASPPPTPPPPKSDNGRSSRPSQPFRCRRQHSFHRPDAIRPVSFHGWRDLQRPANPAETMVGEIQRGGCTEMHLPVFGARFWSITWSKRKSATSRFEVLLPKLLQFPSLGGLQATRLLLPAIRRLLSIPCWRAMSATRSACRFTAATIRSTAYHLRFIRHHAFWIRVCRESHPYMAPYEGRPSTLLLCPPHVGQLPPAGCFPNRSEPHCKLLKEASNPRRLETNGPGMIHGPSLLKPELFPADAQ